MLPSPLQEPSPVAQGAVGISSRLLQWKGRLAPIAMVMLLAGGFLGSAWISRRIANASREMHEGQHALARQATDCRIETMRAAAQAAKLTSFKHSGAEPSETWLNLYEQSREQHDRLSRSLETLGRRFQNEKAWEAAEGCRERTHLMVREADGAEGLFQALRRVADEGRGEEVTTAANGLIDAYHKLDSQLESLASVGTAAAEREAEDLRLAGQSLVTAWLSGSLVVVVICGSVVYLRVRAEYLAKEDEVVRIAQAGDPDADLTGCRVLLAEDGESNQRLIASILQRNGAEVAVVSDGKAALEKFDGVDDVNSEFNILLLDLQMPQLDGLATLTKIRATGCQAPAIALATPAEADSRKACISVGFGDMLQKPVSRDDLIAAVDRARIQAEELQPA
ncbi:MAG: response regulator [Planctomycetales bacterium]|nr:response regulator [Planctomycetales bacterium]